MSLLTPFPPNQDGDRAGLDGPLAQGVVAHLADVLRRIPVIEESLAVSKRVVDRGGFRVTKRVETHEQLVDELLRSETVQIERRPLNTPITDGVPPAIRQEGDTTIVPVVEEMLVTVKRLVLVEEVRITRIHDTHRKPQTCTLRKEHIDIERLDAESPSRVELP